MKNLKTYPRAVYNAGYTTVSNLLKDAGYSLQLNRKEREGKSVPDRNAQFEHINEQAKTFLREGQPVISVDTKKKDKYRTRNWKEYNRALVNRGSITFWFSEDAIANWYSVERTGKQGRPDTYSDNAIRCGLLEFPLKMIPCFRK